VSDTFVKLLAVDGYRATTAKDNAAAWSYWQANKLDARQTIAHRGAVEYGASYVLVLPGDKAPVIRPLDPLRSMAWYEDADDEWPVHALRHRGSTSEGVLWEVIDNENVYTVLDPKDGKDRLKVVSTERHGLGVTPLVRFRDRLDGTPTGIIRPLIIPQDRVNDTVFALSMAMHFASFRQRWATGLAIPVDERQTIENPDYNPLLPEDETNPATIPNPAYGLPVETFDAAVDRLWVTDNGDAKFGDFAQTEVSGHLRAFEQSVTTMAVLGQLPNGMLQGNLVNVSADALGTLYDVTQRQAEVYELLFGEAWEQVFALAAIAGGAEADDTAQVRWRDKEARSFAATVDALGKMVQMLGVPSEAAWERIPGVNDTDVERWRGMASAGDGIKALTDALTRQTAPAAQAPAQGGPPAPQNGA
jgi:hypothetical protein